MRGASDITYNCPTTTKRRSLHLSGGDWLRMVKVFLVVTLLNSASMTVFGSTSMEPRDSPNIVVIFMDDI